MSVLPRQGHRVATGGKRDHTVKGGRGEPARSPVGALRVLLEAGGSDVLAKRPRSAPCGNDRRQASAVRCVSSATESAPQRHRPSSASAASTLYSQPLAMGSQLQPRGASAGGNRKERLLSKKLDANSGGVSWSDLEASKVRVVSILDRLEYLKHLQSGLSDLSNKHAGELQSSCNKSRSRMLESLKHEAPRIEKMLEMQRHTMRAGSTATKRLNKLHRFIVSQEKHYSGQAGAAAARASAAALDAWQNSGDFADPRGSDQADTEQVACDKNESEQLGAVAIQRQEEECNL